MRQYALVALSLLLLTCMSCARQTKPTVPHYAPIAGCSERTAAMTPPAPPKGTDWREWAKAYVGALWAYTDSETRRAETADCLSRQAEID